MIKVIVGWHASRCVAWLRKIGALNQQRGERMDFIDVYYSPKQVSCPDSASPSPCKPAWVVADWIAQDLPIGIVEPIPVSREQLALAHPTSYVDGILSAS